jgi:hypothetical protein
VAGRSGHTPPVLASARPRQRRPLAKMKPYGWTVLAVPRLVTDRPKGLIA